MLYFAFHGDLLLKSLNPKLYGQRSVFVPKMPSLGLLLEEPLFHSYNEKIAAINANLPSSDPFVRPAIDFEIHREKMNNFKEVFIYKNMREVEDRDGLYICFLLPALRFLIDEQI